MKSKADRNSLETTHKRVTGAVKADPLRWQSQGFNYIRIYSGPEMKFSGFNETRDFDISSAKYSCKSLHPLQKLGAQCSKRLSQLKRMVNCIKRHRKKNSAYTHTYHSVRVAHSDTDYYISTIVIICLKPR